MGGKNASRSLSSSWYCIGEREVRVNLTKIIEDLNRCLLSCPISVMYCNVGSKVFGLKGVSPPVIQIMERTDEGKSLTKPAVLQKHTYLVELISSWLSEMSKSGHRSTHTDLRETLLYFYFTFSVCITDAVLDTYRYLHTVNIGYSTYTHLLTKGDNSDQGYFNPKFRTQKKI